MEIQEIHLSGDNVYIPAYYDRVGCKDGSDFSTLMYTGKGAYCLVNIYKLPWEGAVISKGELANMLKDSLSKNQEIVQVSSKKDCNSSIIKNSLVNERGKRYFQYISTYQEFHKGYITVVQLCAEEKDKVGSREADFRFLRSIGVKGTTPDSKEYDYLFPNHPLTLSRAFLRAVQSKGKNELK